MTTKQPKKKQKKSKKHIISSSNPAAELPINSITLGELQLQSNELDMDSLISRMVALLNDNTLKNYLHDLGNRRLIGLAKNSSYID